VARRQPRPRLAGGDGGELAAPPRGPSRTAARMAAMPVRGGDQEGRRTAERAERDRALAAQTRRVRNSVISLAVFCALVVALLLGVPGLRSAGESVSDASLGWVAVGIGLELLSCLGYVILFALVFDTLRRRVAHLLSLSELAVNP